MKDGRQLSDQGSAAKMTARILGALPGVTLAVLLAGAAADALPDWVRENSIAIIFASVLVALVARRPFVSKYVTGRYSSSALGEFYKSDGSLRFMRLDDQKRLFAAKLSSCHSAQQAYSVDP